MAFLMKATRWLVAAAVCLALSMPSRARAVDFEKKLKYDFACVVRAFSSAGDVYLDCKEQKGILKTTVDLPPISSVIGQNMDVKKQVETAKKIARAKMVWAILDFSFSTQLYVLLTFNKDKTLIRDAVAYTQPEFDDRIGRKGKMDL